MQNNTIFATSFSPEYSEHIGADDPLDLLKIIIHDLGIKEIRFGLRWNKVDQNGKLSLSYYEKYIKYLLDHDCKVCLNIGPIKVFRWPEEQIPKRYEKFSKRTIFPDDELAKYSYEYLTNLLQMLVADYGNALDNFTLQVENEGFNRFGHLGVAMSQQHYLEVIKIVKQHLPSNKLMVNSAGRMNLRKILELFDILVENELYIASSLVLGFNYYFRLPHTLPFKEVIDPIRISLPFDMSIKQLHKRQSESGFGLEVSEGQFEPWGVQTSPGNSYDDLLYLVEKSSAFFPEEYPGKLIRLWGTEEFAMKILRNELNDEHRRIMEEIKTRVTI